MEYNKGRGKSTATGLPEAGRACTIKDENGKGEDTETSALSKHK